jgi:hypothetical protein
METRREPLADFLGWFSLGLGVPQVAAPGAVCRAIGVRKDPGSRAWIRLVGVRELSAAAGILGQRRPAPWVWARVAGDAMDLTLLVTALLTRRERPRRILAAIGMVQGIAVADVVAAVRLRRDEPDQQDDDRSTHLTAAITVRRAPEDVYRFFREQRPPPGAKPEWTVEVLADEPNERLAWRAIDGGQVTVSSTAWFSPAPGERGTEVRLEVEYGVPAGILGGAIAAVLGASRRQAREDLRRFKQLLEAGVVARSEATPEGTGKRAFPRQRPAQPAPEPVGAESAS